MSYKNRINKDNVFKEVYQVIQDYDYVEGIYVIVKNMPSLSFNNHVMNNLYPYDFDLGYTIDKIIEVYNVYLLDNNNNNDD